ncbi:hypothetical protein R80B4_00919 [Fibrobacteres bacterium R8-0-B4]
METFEQEFDELKEWVWERYKEYRDAAKKETDLMLDTPLDVAYAKNVQEYNRRLRELKKKYGEDAKGNGLLPKEMQEEINRIRKKEKG